MLSTRLEGDPKVEEYENWKKKSVLKPFILHVMGMVRYYLQFCPNLAEISQPLTNLLRKEANNKQDWGPEQAQAIQHRKNMFVLPTCSSILTQAWRRVFKPTLQNTHWVRFSVIWSSRMANLLRYQLLSNSKKECLAIVWSTDLLLTLLLGHQFVLQTEHSELKQLLTIKMLIFCHDEFTIPMSHSL